MRNNDAKEKIYDELVEFLRQLGWPGEPINKRAIRTYYRGDYGLSEVLIHISEQDVCLVIDPVVAREQDKDWGEAVIRLINAMGEEIHHFGIGVDGDGDLFVKVHIPFAHVNLERFHCLLLGLCQVAENILLPILQANAFDQLKAA